MRVVLKMTKGVSVELQKGTSQDELVDKLEELVKHIRGVQESGGRLSVIEVELKGSRWVRILFDEEDTTLSETVTVSVHSEKEKVKETDGSTSEDSGQKKKGAGRKKN